MKMKTLHSKTWCIAKAKLRRIFVTINPNVRKDERYQFSNFSIHVKKLKTKEHTKSKQEERRNKDLKLMKYKTNNRDLSMKAKVGSLKKPTKWINFYL